MDTSTIFLPRGLELKIDLTDEKFWQLCHDNWDALTLEEQNRFAPLCPDFVVELMSVNDSLEVTRKKMNEYRENGAQLGWLINRKQRQIEIYRLNQEVEILNNPQTVSGEDILPGFVLDLATIW